jgi:D-3-phosphoglycerate dehydrogenase / 2-oxoglutarate reductase
MTASPIVIITPPGLMVTPSPHVSILEQAGISVKFCEHLELPNACVTEDEIIHHLRGVVGVIAGAELFSKRVIEGLPQLRVIARAGVGYDRVDVAAATARQIAVTITPNANHECVAEHTLALLFAAAKSVVANDAIVRQGKWIRPLTEPLRGATFGIVGLGRIGKSLAVRLKALRMRVLVSEKFPPVEFITQQGLELVSLPELLRESDYVSLHCPVTPETEGLMNAQLLSLMKPTATLINTARGNLIVERDLVAALRTGQLRTACLDVFDPEPPEADHPLLSLPNVILSPHLGGLDKLSLQNMGNEAAQAIVDLLHGRWPTGSVVNEELKAAWKF